jgi:hypothetical protein
MTLKELKEDIESLSKHHQVEVLRILNSGGNKELLNENQNGTFVNMTSLPEITIQALRDFCSYVKEQQQTLQSIEEERTRLEERYFKGIKAYAPSSTN